MQRLYVGGLSHTVTQKDLKDRFGKFGGVEDVELRTRRDDEGIPYKTFAYVNISISDTDLKKCMTVLNKSKWKGGTLQIEPAKESFLHRLALEREAELQLPNQPAAEHHRQKVLDSLSKAGVDNFTMKAAVPGTEIPGHKDWVVSKFGRVLPIMQLKCRKGNKSRTLKYDPSKYSHNIRRLASSDADLPTPVAQLTWEVDGGDDDISKKRRGEFPPYEPPRPKKSRTDVVMAVSTSRQAQPVVSFTKSETHQLTNGFKAPINHRQPQRRGPRYEDSDVDSDEEIRRLVELQQPSHDALWHDGQEDNLEVVGYDYLDLQEHRDRSVNEEEDYDSADTDELFASRKPYLPVEEKLPEPNADNVSGREAERMKNAKTKMTYGEEGDTSGKAQCAQQRQLICSSVNHIKEDDEDEIDSDDSESDSDYEAMFSNVTHLEISMADLQRLAEEFQETSETPTPSIPTEKLTPGPAQVLTPKKGTLPEDILASLLGEDSSGDEQKPKKTTLPAFQGTRTLNGGSQTDNCPRTKNTRIQASDLKHVSESESAESDDDTEVELDENDKALHTPKFLQRASPCTHPEKTDTRFNLSEDEGEQEGRRTMASQPIQTSSSFPEDATSHSEEEEEEKEILRRLQLSAHEEEERQRKDNLRRLSAVQQRKKEAEEQKKLIQGALANVDGLPKRTGKHIVFDSDSDDDEQTVVMASKKSLLQDSQSEVMASGDEEAAASDCGPIKNKEHLKQSGPRLFSSSEDEEDEDEEKDETRFNLRPQFEGRAGQKLMALQSRFGTDERFRMDSRFLEEEVEENNNKEELEVKTSLVNDDEALQEERKRNMSILHNVLGQQPTTGKTTSKAKTFRDVSALHYDPSKEEHATFEAKADDTKKESKSARRKKKEEAQKLPEVSKEIYYDVTGDLKALFGQTKHDKEAEEVETSWDQVKEDDGAGEDEEQPAPMTSLFTDASAGREQSSGFTFSFFGNDLETESEHTAEYKVESIQAAKVSWQQDPRLQDSSSEGEEEEEEKEEEQEEKSTSAPKNNQEETPPRMDLFFFHLNDSRLLEGPRWFCRSSQLEEEREQWEERRMALKEEYRKKHKDARRKLKSSQKS